ncbi:carboxylate--amine ligase [Halorussus salilacus]|uniref:carboxylate--amine ligase n=1 Tax=Halorussus salilacus TaxID=2953750 RepID=UPI00209F0504|nr:carboxylate--amine ligase [Halorussus salilacus]USZ66729.1 carboxylate--amine ligase [Halorussus salilacus]
MGTSRDHDTSVVVPAIDVASSTACLRSLGRSGIRTIAVSELDDPPGFRSKYADETVSTPDPCEDISAYAEALLSLAKREDVLTIVPLRETDVFALAKRRGAFEAHVETPWPDLDTLRGAQDRIELFEAAAEAGVSAPETASFDDWTDWDVEVVVKPRYTLPTPEYVGKEAASAFPQRSTTYVEPGRTPDRDELVAEMGHVPLVQEYVPDTSEYGFFALYDEGEAVATFQHRQRRGYKYCGGPSAYRESVDIPELDAAGRALLDELDWHGLAMVEFLRNPETGAFELMEVNPRFWSSLPFTVQAGVDFPDLYRSMAEGDLPDDPPEYEVGIAGHLLRGELLHLHSILFEDYPLVERPSFAETASEVLGSVADSPRFDYLSADDPGPFVRDFERVVEDALGTGSFPRIRAPRRASSPTAALGQLFSRG